MVQWLISGIGWPIDHQWASIKCTGQPIGHIIILKKVIIIKAEKAETEKVVELNEFPEISEMLINYCVSGHSGILSF